MYGSRRSQEHTVSSLLGAGASLTGELYFDGILRLDGHFKGSIKTPGTLIVGREATVDGDIRASEVQIFGFVRATIDCDQRVEICKGGTLQGEVRAPTLVIEEGSTFEGLSGKIPTTTQETFQSGKQNDVSGDMELECEGDQEPLHQSH